jgi:class 3 adenylate cyclase
MNRRLAAILAADIAGYCRLMHEDETSTVREGCRTCSSCPAALESRLQRACRNRCRRTVTSGWIPEPVALHAAALAPIKTLADALAVSAAVPRDGEDEAKRLRQVGEPSTDRP